MQELEQGCVSEAQGWALHTPLGPNSYQFCQSRHCPGYSQARWLVGNAILKITWEATFAVLPTPWGILCRRKR